MNRPPVTPTPNPIWPPCAPMAVAGRASVQIVILLVLLAAGIGLVYAVNSLATPFRNSASGTAESHPTIHEAATKGDLGTLKQEIARGTPVDAKLDTGEPGRQGMTPLMSAAMAGKADAVKALLDAKAKTDARTDDGRTPLFFAAAWGGPACVQALIDAGARVDARAEGGWTPLMLAAARGDAATLKALIDAGADVTAANKYRQTPLMFAAISGDEAKLNVLLGVSAAVVRAVDKDGNTALSKAAESEVGPGVLSALLAAGAEADAKDNDGVTPLMKAALRGDAAQVKVLLAAGASTTAKDARGWTAGEYAGSRGAADEKAQAVLALLNAGK